MADYSGYTATIGIECHVQLKTKTKLFSGAGNDAREAPPNSLISHVDLGLPGALPVLNKEAITLGVRAGLALQADIQKFNKFDRKHYFYPDLPLGYQITQFYNPIIRNGRVIITIDGQKKEIGIHEAHLEADAGKSTHPAGKDYSLVDLNRAGTPLLEIVSEPAMHSPLEAKLYARELWLLMRYADVSDASLYYGNMRFDVNVSVSKSGTLGTRTETKNLNSFRSVERAAEYEISRQIERLEAGEEIIQETRGWDDSKQKTFSQRSKEDAHDYRYMPDPDIPPVVITDGYIAAIAAEMPLMPEDLRVKFSTLGLDSSAIETLLDEIPAGRFMNTVATEAEPDSAKMIGNWLVSVIQALVTSGSLTWETAQLDYNSFVTLARMARESRVSSSAAKEILEILVTSGGDPEKIATEKNLLQVSDTSELEKIVAHVLADNPKAAGDVKNGEMKAIGFLVGQAMKESKGTANPGLVQEIIKRQLEVS